MNKVRERERERTAWNDGVDDGGAYDKDHRARAKRYTTNRATFQQVAVGLE